MQNLNRLLLSLYDAAQTCSLLEFHEHALAQARRALRFDSAAVLTASVSEDQELAIQNLHFHNQSNDTLTDREALTTPDQALAQAWRHRGGCIAADSSALFRDTDFMHYCKKHGIAHSLVLIPPTAKAGNFDLISLWRARPRSAYASDDIRIGDLLLPHLMKAREINQRLAFGAGAAVLPQQISLVSSKAGRLYFIDDAAIALLQSEWRQWTPPLLPPALLAALKDGASQLAGRGIMATTTVRDKLLFIQLSPTSGLPRLTPAELQVAGLAARGLSYKEIAREQDISPATVRNQLHSVYKKLGVSNKAALTAALPRH
jgi:DNA-binding CsgD family transcriptional regulator